MCLSTLFLGQTEIFSIVQPQASLHKWLLAPVFCHGGFVVPFGKGPLDASKALPSQKVKPTHAVIMQTKTALLHAIHCSSII